MTQQCPTCLGDGVITETRADYGENGDPVGVYPEQVECWTCEGTGKVDEPILLRPSEVGER